MIAPENPYMLPSVLVAAVAYLGVTLVTDASLLVRIGLLVLIAGVVPVVLNLLFGSRSTDDARDDSLEESDAADTEESHDA